MEEKELVVCDECGSLFLRHTSQMMWLFPEWPMCELLLGWFNEGAHQGTKSTGGNKYAYNRMDGKIQNDQG
ncbi:MAG: hypothetical protein KHY46_11255 [Clostridiales bacterium]|uniref:hypothetical protein n=1 Tax=Enterocloster sp. TaxID=2719315 RepID=UPI00174B4E02|nr:hypothetical protein [Clostridiales bacterium]